MKARTVGGRGSVLLLLDKRGIRSSKIELLPAVFKPTGTARNRLTPSETMRKGRYPASRIEQSPGQSLGAKKKCRICIFFLRRQKNGTDPGAYLACATAPV